MSRGKYRPAKPLLAQFTELRSENTTQGDPRGRKPAGLGSAYPRFSCVHKWLADPSLQCLVGTCTEVGELHICAELPKTLVVFRQPRSKTLTHQAHSRGPLYKLSRLHLLDDTVSFSPTSRPTSGFKVDRNHATRHVLNVLQSVFLGTFPWAAVGKASR